MSPSSDTHKSVIGLYISRIGLPILLQEICGPILGIYKSLRDTRMWKLGLRQRNSQKRNTKMEFSLKCKMNVVNVVQYFEWVLAVGKWVFFELRVTNKLTICHLRPQIQWQPSINITFQRRPLAFTPIFSIPVLNTVLYRRIYPQSTFI